jgi:4,4'-diaponeurosporenoate glycosyltransferase
MVILLGIAAAGLVGGWLLLRSVPRVSDSSRVSRKIAPITVIIPARNEAVNLPALLGSLPKSESSALEILVVDDGSTDATAAIAAQHHATVLASLPLPQGWTGKNWACHQGSLVASNEVLFFLDADTRFLDGGFEAILQYFAGLPPNSALSLLPFHRTMQWYEELSIFFNIVMAMGAGGFGRLDKPHLFGPSLLLRNDLYRRAGGHRAVRQHILENLELASCLSTAGGKLHTLGGRGAFETRMFPLGFSQLCESWKKAFAAGARSTSPLVLGFTVGWLAAAMLTFLMLFAVPRTLLPAAVGLYAFFAGQIAWFSKQLGSFRLLTAVFYPISLVFYFAVFGQSLWMQLAGRSVRWRGREV